MSRLATTWKTVVGGSILFLLATACFPSSQTKREDSQQSCRDFVQKFYDWYVPKLLKAFDTKEDGGWGLALRYKGSEFSPELVRQLKEDRDAQDNSPGEIVGLDFDPFLYSQDPSEHFVVGNITDKDGRYLVEVYGMSSGKRREKVVPELVRKNGRWLFVNFHYPDSGHGSGKDGDLLHLLKSLREDRQNHPK